MAVKRDELKELKEVDQGALKAALKKRTQQELNIIAHTASLAAWSAEKLCKVGRDSSWGPPRKNGIGVTKGRSRGAAPFGMGSSTGQRIASCWSRVNSVLLQPS